MKFFDLVEAFDENDADAALLSTYNFDPSFFEKILLPTRALRKSRHVIVFMDEQRWRAMCRTGFDSRALNRLYHVVPVSSATAVFHPKLQLLLGEGRATLLCGSHNLSNPGFTGNLELTAKIQVTGDDALGGLAQPVWDALQFFRKLAEQQGDLHRRVTRRWLPQLVQEYKWLAQGAKDGEVQLVHSLSDGESGEPKTLWDRLRQEWGDELEELSIVSPFYDRDLGMLRDLRARYPRARVEVTAQQYQTNLPPETFGAEFAEYRLHALKTDARRLHGKLLAWQAADRSGYLLGSANFTRPGLRGANIEACLLVRTPTDPVKALFRGDLGRRLIAPESFRAGDEDEPGSENATPQDALELQYAALNGEGLLQLRLRTPQGPPSGTKVQLRQGGEAAVSVVVPWDVAGPECRVTLEASQLRVVRGALMTSLRASGTQGAWTYVLQENTLERDVGMSGHERARRRIELTGEGLSRELRDLAEREGLEAALEFLRSVRIRFADGSRHGGRAARFSIKVHDPDRSDADDWLGDEASRTSWRDALVLFAEDHERLRLRRHARQGNVNGIENLVDIFATVVGILFEYNRRGVFPDGLLINWTLKYVRVVCQGYEDSKIAIWGYLVTAVDNLDGDTEELAEQAKLHALAAHLRAALLIAQVTRWTEKEKARFPEPRTCHPAVLSDLRKSLKDAGIRWPSAEQAAAALASYGVLSEEELLEWELLLDGESAG